MSTRKAYHDRTNGGDQVSLDPEPAGLHSVSGSKGLAQAMSMEPPKAFALGSFRLYLICAVGFLCCTMNGYDGYLLNGLLQNENFKEYFNGNNTGIWVSWVASFYQFGSIAAVPFSGPALDTLGRRKGIFIGACVIILGTTIQGTVICTHSVKQFMAGRFFLGFGAQLTACGGPIYVLELCHPAYRGVVTGLFQTFWWTGAIIASGAVRGSLNLSNNGTWLLPLWMQLLSPIIIAVSILFLPESPRWLFVNNDPASALAIITKYHGNSNRQSIWVTLQETEFRHYLKQNGADRRWWDYRVLFRNRASIYRLLCSGLVAVFAQCVGNAVLSLLLSAVLDTAGIRNQVAQTNLGLGLSCLQLAMAIAGAFLVDLVGRRWLLIFTNTALGTVWLGMTVATSLHVQAGSAGTSRAILALIFIFDIIYACGFTSVQVLYAIEVLSFEMRAKGYAFTAIFINVAGFFNQFVWPIALARIGWKTYILLMFWCFVQALVIYFVIPETRYRTLEEIDAIFSEKNPRKASVQKRAIPSTVVAP